MIKATTGICAEYAQYHPLNLGYVQDLSVLQQDIIESIRYYNKVCNHASVHLNCAKNYKVTKYLPEISL